MPETQATTDAKEVPGQRHGVSVLVNEQSVVVEGPRTTGLQIKEAAISQGLPIDAGFQLIEELPHGRTQIVGDGDSITVHPGSRFLALAPDDNS